MYSLVVGGCLHIAYHAQCHWEAVLIVHHGQFQLQGVVFAVGIVHQHIVDGVAVFAHLYHLQSKTLLHQSVLVVLAKHQFFAVLHVDGVLFAPLLIIYRVVTSVVEYHAVLQYLAHRCSLVLVGCLEHLNGGWGVGGNGTCKEVSASAEAQFGRAEGVFNGAIGARLADKAAWTGGRVLSFGQSVDAVVEQYHVEVDIAPHGVYKVVSADGKSVTVAAYLPHGKVGVGHLGARSDGGSTSMHGLHGVGVHIIG